MPESRVFKGLPPHAPGQRIGLYGGSFNPAHGGHRQASLLAMRRLGLDWVWWLATPGNPLKRSAALPPLSQRMAKAARVAAHPRIAVTGIEAELGTRYTADLVRELRRRAPGVDFVWVMGGDNLAQFHRWDRWEEIAASMPLAIVNRPGYLTAPLWARAAIALRPYRIDEGRALALAGAEPPAWVYLNGPRSQTSSTALRAARSS